jgi:hypothetical protein
MNQLVFFFFFSSFVTVAEKLKSEGRAEIFRDETMEELEDDEGNVYNRKVALPPSFPCPFS